MTDDLNTDKQKHRARRRNKYARDLANVKYHQRVVPDYKKYRRQPTNLNDVLNELIEE